MKVIVNKKLKREDDRRGEGGQGKSEKELGVNVAMIEWARLEFTRERKI